MSIPSCPRPPASPLRWPLSCWAVSPAYASAYPVILVLLAALPFQLIAYLVTPLANAHERLLPRIVLVSAAIAAINAVGDVVLVPRFGINGAAVATTAAFTIGGFLLIRVIGAVGFPFAALWRYAAPAAIMLPAVVTLNWLGPARGAGVVSAALLVLVTGTAYRHLAGATSPAQSPVSMLLALGRALTLSEAVPPS